MPLYGGRRFAEWTTIEGPAPVQRGGPVLLRLQRRQLRRRLRDRRGRGRLPARPLSRPPRPRGADLRHDARAGRGPRPLLGRPARPRPRLDRPPRPASRARPSAGSGSARRRGAPDGVTIGDLTDRPQPAPPLPTDLCRFDGAGRRVARRLAISSRATGGSTRDGLRHDRARRAGLRLARRRSSWPGDWVAEVYLALPGRRPRHGGAGRPGRRRPGLSVWRRPATAAGRRSPAADGRDVRGPLADAWVTSRSTPRASTRSRSGPRSGRAEVRRRRRPRRLGPRRARRAGAARARAPTGPWLSTRCRRRRRVEPSSECGEWPASTPENRPSRPAAGRL